jgi:hypothetical protein
MQHYVTYKASLCVYTRSLWRASPTQAVAATARGLGVLGASPSPEARRVRRMILNTSSSAWACTSRMPAARTEARA